LLQPGDTIDIWVVESALGSGGMGSVYRCHNRAATRILAAIKVLDGGLKRYPEAEARFIREAEILFQLDHPNIVKVRNVRIDADPPYLEMEFVAGESLDERLRRGPVPYFEAVGLMRQVAEALHYLHGKGIRHRDIKPANLLVTPEARGMSGPRLKLVDFGLAVEADGSRITQNGMAFGTVSYAPPEWIIPESLDPTKWDIYAMGVVFHELLTGSLAFPVSGQGTARQQAMQVIIAKQGHTPLDPGPAFHDDIRELIRDMTMPDATARLADAGLVVQRVNALEPTLKRAAGVTLAPSAFDDPFLASLPPQTESVHPQSTPQPMRLDPGRPQQGRLDQGRLGRRRIEHTTPVTLPGRRVARVALVMSGLGALALVGLAAAGAGLAAVWWNLQPEARDVVVEAHGDAPVELRLQGAAPVDGRFVAVPFGPATVQWVAGVDCGPFGSEPAPWCLAGTETFEIVAGTDAQHLGLHLPSLAPREVALALPGLPGEVAVRAKLGEIVGSRTPSGLAFAAVAPGRGTLTVAAGSCPAELWSCEGECPPGCVVLQQPLVVPAQGEPEPASLALVLPQSDTGPASTAPVSAGVPDVPDEPTRRVSTPGRAGRIITRAQLATFVEKQPEWAPGGLRAASTGKYLPWWPEQKDAQGPATGMTPALAEAYCQSLGLRLPRRDDEPKLQPGSSSSFELREVDGSLMLIESLDNELRNLPAERNKALSSLAVFRCVK
jgi:serine/threonine protein kinase